MAKLGEVCDFYAGTGFPNEYQGRVTGKYPFYKVGDISKNVLEGNRELKICANYVEEDVVQKLKGSILPPKTIVFAKIGEALKLNRRAITSCECLVDNNVMGIKAQNVRLNDEYLFYWLQNLNLSDYSESTTVPSVKKSRLQNIEINVSPLEEQEKVVSTLNKLSSLILARKKQLSKLDELVKARFVEMFENSLWPNTSLNDICSEIVDCPHSTPKYEGNLEHPAIRTTEIKNGYIDWDSMKYVSEEEYQKRIKSLKPVPGDIVYGREGTYGNAAIIPDGYEFCLGQRVMLFRPNKTKCISAYVLYAILSDHVKRQADEKNVGATVPHVNVADAKQFDVVLPPLSIQNQFAAFVERVDQQKQTVQQSLEKLELMKKALMQEYFG